MAEKGPFQYAAGLVGMDPAAGFDTAAAGAQAAGQDANNLSNLQWQRQMAGLQQAQGYTNQLQGLYNSIYSPGGGQMAAGGVPTPGYGQGGMSHSAMMGMQPKPPGYQSQNPGAMMLLAPPTQPAEPEKSQLEKDFKNYMPGESINNLKRGEYGQAIMNLSPTVRAAGDVGTWVAKKLGAF